MTEARWMADISLPGPEGTPMLDSLISRWRNNQRYLLTSGSYEFEPKVPFVDINTRGRCRSALLGATKSQYHLSATLPGQEYNCWRLGSGSQTAYPIRE